MQFMPRLDLETVQMDGTPIAIVTNHQCITAMKDYESKSIEELRFEDYLLKQKYKRQSSAPIALASPIRPQIYFDSKKTAIGTPVKFNPVSGTDCNENRQPISTLHQCITVMSEYEAKSFEELKYEDYKANRRFAPHPILNLFASSAKLGNLSSSKQIKFYFH